jgi:hypothetical protein
LSAEHIMLLSVILSQSSLSCIGHPTQPQYLNGTRIQQLTVYNSSYLERLPILGLESLELRCLHFDLIHIIHLTIFHK